MINGNRSGENRSQKSTGANRQACPKPSPTRNRCASGSVAETQRNSCALQSGGAL